MCIGIRRIRLEKEVDDGRSFVKIKTATEYGREGMIYQLGQTEKAAALFAGWQETMIWSCMQGVMGKIYVNSLTDPVSAMAILGDFCFLTGKPDKEMVLYPFGPADREILIMIPREDAWAGQIEACYGKRAKKTVRYATRKEPDIFEEEKLQRIVEGLPDGFSLKKIDQALFERCKELEWCRDLVRQYEDYAVYCRRGLGVAILKDGEPVSGASSYSGYIGGIEVEIDTREDMRRNGLARICGAKLILECLRRGWYPSWDAQNTWSADLAEKLGYHLSGAYTAYEVMWKNPEE